MDDFSQFNLDIRLLKAISDKEWRSPTNIQSESLPRALKGDHLLIRSKTGSGKTGIYLITVIEAILEDRKNKKFSHALILAPSYELVNQICEALSDLLKYLKEIKFINTSKISEGYHGILDEYHIIVATPKKAIDLFSMISVSNLDRIRISVFDEADLLFTYGHKEALDMLANMLPTRQQCLILSASLTPEVEELCTVNLYNPQRVVADDEALPDQHQLQQYLIKCESEDRFVILYSLIVLKLLKGKILIFTNSINACYKLLLFFKTFSIQSCVLNHELPINTRLKTIERFKKNKSQILIACDMDYSDPKSTEFNISRGIDLINIENVINFDFPSDPESYLHRIGRTARADSVGLCFTFATPSDKAKLSELEQFMSQNTNNKLLPFKFKMEQIQGFRYRVDDAVRNITKSALVNIRRSEIKEEISNNKDIQEHFKSKPFDKQVFKSESLTKKPEFHLNLSKLPSYLIPESMKDSYVVELDKSKNFTINRRKQFMAKKMNKRRRTRDPLKMIKKSKIQTNLF